MKPFLTPISEHLSLSPLFQIPRKSNFSSFHVFLWNIGVSERLRCIRWDDAVLVNVGKKLRNVKIYDFVLEKIGERFSCLLVFDAVLVVEIDAKLVLP